ncbi:hypothetical protein LINGRAHAP2_LOCUS29403, partial [Linum grandiflorum]
RGRGVTNPRGGRVPRGRGVPLRSRGRGRAQPVPSRGRGVPVQRGVGIRRCSLCQSATHNARCCLRRRGIQEVNTVPVNRNTRELEVLEALSGVGVYVSPTGNSYFRDATTSGGGNVRRVTGSQPPTTQPTQEE